jgi:uncharacterized DUF497 family protein
MRFEWDDAKEASNELKYGISFVDAATVFDDPYHIVENTTKPEHGEERRKAIGIISEYLVAVIYTDRQARRRIISARRASKHEREQYHQRKATRRWHLRPGAS